MLVGSNSQLWSAGYLSTIVQPSQYRAKPFGGTVLDMICAGKVWPVKILALVVSHASNILLPAESDQINRRPSNLFIKVTNSLTGF